MRTAAAAAALLLAGLACTSAADAPAVRPVTTMAVGLTEFAIGTSAERLADGTVTLEVTNAGATAHDLRVVGADVDVSTAILAPGTATTLRVDAVDERILTLWCTLPSHRSRGMETTLTVDGPGPSGQPE
jgi:uncharacterized cupredoxin-like copper-binding protein